MGDTIYQYIRLTKALYLQNENIKKKGVEFIIEPYIRFKGLAGEQATMFFKDPSGNALEFKAFQDEYNVERKKIAYNDKEIEALVSL